MEYDLNLIDGGLIALVIVIVGYLKRFVAERWIPVLPFLVSAILAALAVVSAAGGWPGWAAFAARTFLETLKIAFASMGLFKLYKTTIMGD